MVLVGSSFASAITAFGLLVNIVVATGPLNGLPILNGPVPAVPQVFGSKKHVGEFIHPGLWHTHDDLERIRLGVAKGQEPWKSAYEKFSADSFSQSSVSWIYLFRSFMRLIFDLSTLCKAQKASSVEVDAAITTQPLATMCARHTRMH